jgi:hypothetical protein
MSIFGRDTLQNGDGSGGHFHANAIAGEYSNFCLHSDDFAFMCFMKISANSLKADTTTLKLN